MERTISPFGGSPYITTEIALELSGARNLSKPHDNEARQTVYADITKLWATREGQFRVQGSEYEIRAVCREAVDVHRRYIAGQGGTERNHAPCNQDDRKEKASRTEGL